MEGDPRVPLATIQSESHRSPRSRPYLCSSLWLGSLLGAAAVPLWLDDAPLLATPHLALANLAPWLLLWLLCATLVRRPLLNLALCGGIALLLFTAHQLKLRNLGLPLVPSDALALQQIASNPELFLRYLEFRPWMAALPLVLLALLRFERPALAFRSRLWWLAASIGIIASASLIARGPPWYHLYSPTTLAVAFWTPARAAADYGATALFMALQQNTRTGLPDPDPEVVAAIRRHLPPATVAAPGDLPDLIVLQSESLFDPSILVGVRGEDFLPELQALRARYPHGDLKVPTFGGLTTRTEFEFLTGYPLRSAPGIQYPFQGLVHKPLPALPWRLAEMGYRTHAVHPYDHRFYGRDTAYPRLGFEQFLSQSAFAAEDYHGFYINDAALGRMIVRLAEDPAPQLVFAVSMENHGPWNEDRGGIAQSALPSLTTPPALAGHDLLPLRRFLYHLQRSDAALGDLARWVEQRDEPTLLLLFGDHLPNLMQPYPPEAFVDARPVQKQHVPWIMVDNRGGAAAERIDMDSSQLAAFMLDRAGLAADPHFYAVEALRQRSDEIGEENRLLWQGHWVAARLQEPPKKRRDRWKAVDHVRLLGSVPAGVEAGQHRRVDLPLRLSLASAPPRSAYFTLRGHQLAQQSRSGGDIHLAVAAELANVLFKDPGRLPLAYVDPVRQESEEIGSFEVRPRAPRLGAEGWRGERAFCAISAWGPQQTPLDPPANRQPDGSMGLWVRAECMPPEARVVVAGVPLDTDVTDTLATARLHLSERRPGEQLPVSLLADDDALDLGMLMIEPTGSR